MKPEQIQEIRSKQRAFFSSGATLDVNRRIAALKKLEHALIEHEAAIARALHDDLGKSPVESYMCETGMVRSEIRYLLRHIRRFAREQRVATPLAQFPSRSYRKPTDQKAGGLFHFNISETKLETFGIIRRIEYGHQKQNTTPSKEIMNYG